MTAHRHHRGFSLIELLIAATVFTFVMTGVSQLFTSATNLQRRATGFQRIQENALFVTESIAREVRVSKVQGSGCSETLTIEHPDNGDVTYQRVPRNGIYVLQRKSSVRGGQFEDLTSPDVDVTRLQFCVTHAGVDNQQVRVTIPLEFSSVSAQSAGRVSVSMQTTVVSRDLVEELSN